MHVKLKEDVGRMVVIFASKRMEGLSKTYSVKREEVGTVTKFNTANGDQLVLTLGRRRMGLRLPQRTFYQIRRSIFGSY